MTGLHGNMNKMFRWLKDRKKLKGADKKSTSPEDDYGFRKKHVIVQETENGHSVIIRDNGTTFVYPQSFCKLNYRARMPTPIQTYKETSSHIYDEIPELPLPARRRLDNSEAMGGGQDVDIIKDTRRERCDNKADFKNAIEVGPYLIVPIVNSTDPRDVEIFKRNDVTTGNELLVENHICTPTTENDTPCKCSETPDLCSEWTHASGVNIEQGNGEFSVLKDAKVVLTRCVKSKTSELVMTDNATKDMSTSTKSETDLCSFDNVAFDSDLHLRSRLESPGSDSNSRTLTGTPESSTRTPDNVSERSISCAITDETEATTSNSVDVVDVANIVGKRRSTNDLDDNETCSENDVSSGESEMSIGNDYNLYLSKIENNLKLKHDVRKMLKTIDKTIPEREEDGMLIHEDIETMTYVSSLSEYSSAPSHVSDVSADRSCSDDSSGYYDCAEEIQKGSRDRNRESRVSLERSVSAPVSSPTHVKKVLKLSHKLKDKDKSSSKTKKSQQSSRSNSFDSNFYKALSDEDKEMYLFPSSKQSDCSLASGSRNTRSKPVLTPQPTPIYMEPYRGKSRSHNRLLGDLIRMNYDKQLFIH